jgi:SAM-dependent methyltransferase
VGAGLVSTLTEPVVGTTQTRARDCPVCGGRRSSPLLSHDEWRLVRCGDCTLPYMPVIPTDEAVDRDFDWSRTFAETKRNRWLNTPGARLWTAFLLPLRSRREARAMRQIRRSAPPGRMLDIGCGTGRLDAMALKRGYDPLGIEISPAMAARAVQRLGPERVRMGRLRELDLPVGSFDLAVGISYMEHEPDPLPVLRHLRELLKPGGVFLVKTPNYDCWLRTLRGPRWSGYRWPEHVQYFTPATLSRLAHAAGFSVVRVEPHPLNDNFWLVMRRESA